MVWGYKVAREIARRMDGFRGERELSKDTVIAHWLGLRADFWSVFWCSDTCAIVTSLHPHFHPQSPARCIDIE